MLEIDCRLYFDLFSSLFRAQHSMAKRGEGGGRNGEEVQVDHRLLLLTTISLCATTDQNPERAIINE